MKKMLPIITLLLVVAWTLNADANQVVKIESHSFGVITEDQRYPDSGKCERLALYIRNERCVARYKIVLGGVVLGEGEIDCKRLPKTIQLGKTNLYILCQGYDLIVTLR